MPYCVDEAVRKRALVRCWWGPHYITPVKLWLSKLESHILLEPAIPLLEFKDNILHCTKLFIAALLVIFKKGNNEGVHH